MDSEVKQNMLQCAICGMEVESIKTAIQENWVPGFFENDFEHGPACPHCSETLLQAADDGEYELLPAYQGKIVYFDEPEDDLMEYDDCMVEDVILGFILN
jgi:hypothetical protein